MVSCSFVFLGAAGLLVQAWMPAVRAGSSAPPAGSAKSQEGDPDAACAGCHQAIFERYRKTPMANASGRAEDGYLPGSFTHAASGVSYRLEKNGGHVYLAFWREPAGSPAGSGDDTTLNGRRELAYFIGSGRRGRTYLFQQDGYWFEIPVNWYGKKRIWDMAPNYQNAREMPLTLPVDPGCLGCHSSQAQPSLPEARNKYAGAPFLEGGITCTACHGDASAHLASGGKMPMLKLAELEPVRRDSVCLNCHLEGQAAIVHAGKRLVDFRPGDSIFDYTSFFVAGQSAGTGPRATSQWEALQESGCRRGAGQALTCTSCHDPHGSTAAMSAAERTAYYRGRCLACHDAETARAEGTMTAASGAAVPGFAASHHAEKPDCTACHMPRARAEDIAHEQVTDHRIPRIAGREPAPANAGGERLIAIGTGGAPENDGNAGRDLGLAYAQMAQRGDREAGERALELLRAAEAAPGAEADGQLHERLGFLEQLAGDKTGAAKEYQQALSADAYDAVAAGNLALLRAGSGDLTGAVRLWERAFAEDPVQLAAGRNLAIVECRMGNKEAALGTLDRILEFSPDDGAARELARKIRTNQAGCGSR